MIFLNQKIHFPPVEMANEDGLLAVGGDLRLERLLLAYNSGIFPWFEEGQPILWWSPDPRMILFPQELKISKSMKQLLRKDFFRVSYNEKFGEVIRACAAAKREGQNGTWITSEMISAYKKLHEKGIAQSVEVWKGQELIGGLYGVYLREKNVFCGESMFSNVSNASKFGFIKMVKKLEAEGVKLIDCQVYTAHLESLGAKEIPRAEFLNFLK